MSARGNANTPRGRRPPSTPKNRENQMVSLAMDLAERRMLEGTASASEVIHFLKLGTSRELLEQERLRQENGLLAVKAENLASAKRVEELYEAALDAMRTYSGQDDIRYLDDDED